MPEQVTRKLEEILTNLHTQLYVMRSHVAAWQSSTTASGASAVEDEKTEKTFSLMEQCCQMDWKIGQGLLALLKTVREKGEQKGSSVPVLMGTSSPILSKSLPNATALRHPSSIVSATSTSHAAN